MKLTVKAVRSKTQFEDVLFGNSKTNLNFTKNCKMPPEQGGTKYENTNKKCSLLITKPKQEVIFGGT